MLGKMQLYGTECPEDKPSVVQNCNEDVPCPEMPSSCSPTSDCAYIVRDYCNAVLPSNIANLKSLCKSNCCNCDCAK